MRSAFRALTVVGAGIGAFFLCTALAGMVRDRGRKLKLAARERSEPGEDRERAEHGAGGRDIVGLGIFDQGSLNEAPTG